MASLSKTYESWSPAYSAAVTNPNWVLTRSSTGVTLTHTGMTPDTLDGWIIIPVPVINNTVNFDRGPTPTEFSFRLALQNSATLSTIQLWDSEKSVMSVGMPPGPGGPGEGPADGSPQTITLGLIPGQVGELKIGATVAAHVTFKEAPNADGKSEIRLIGAGVAFEFVDPAVPATQPIGIKREAQDGGMNKGVTVTVK
jgi:hypothetical protein